MASSPLERAYPVTLRLAFAPEAAGARAMSLAVRAFLADNGVDERELFSFELCVAEAGINAIEYAEGPARRLRPMTEVLLTPQKLEIRIIDFTPGFEMPERIDAPSPLDERGRGLFLIQSVMDKVLYIRGRHENALIMRKDRKGAKDGDDSRVEFADNPLAGKRDETYPRGPDSADPFNTQAQCPGELHTPGRDLVRRFQRDQPPRLTPA